MHVLPTRANTQPAFATYLEDTQARIWRPAGLIVLALRGDKIAVITRFHYDHLFPRFGFPLELPDK